MSLRRYIQLEVERPITSVQLADRGYEPFVVTAIKGVNIDFNIVLDRTAGPNTMEALVFNLSEDHRYRLRKSPRSKVLIKFGYDQNQMFPLFRGTIRSSRVTRDKTEIVTTIEAASGEVERYQWVNKSFGRNTRLRNVLEYLVSEMGVDQGNLEEVYKISETNSLPLEFKKGFVANGHAADIFARLMGSRGIEWSIQTIGGRESLQIIKAGQAIQGGEAIPVLAPGQGLIGIPAVDSNNVMQCDALIRPNLYPGRLVDVRSKFLGGSDNRETSSARFKLTRVELNGSLYGECKATIEGKKVDPA